MTTWIVDEQEASLPGARRPSPAEAAGPARRPALVRLAVVAVDAVSVAGGLSLAYRLQGRLPVTHPQHIDGGDHLLLGVLALPLWLVLFSHYRLYRTRHIQSRLQELKRVLGAVGASVVAMAFIATMLKLTVTRTWLILCLPTAVVAVSAGREVVRRVFAGQRRRGHLMRPVVIVGSNREAKELRSMLVEDRALGYLVVAFVDSPDSPGSPLAVLDGLPVLSHAGDVVETVKSRGATGALIATSDVDLETANRLARRFTEQGIHVELSSSLRDIAAERLTLRSLGRHPVVYVEPVRLGWRAGAKRALDLVVAAGTLVVTSPLLAAAAVAIKLDTRGPVLFRQQRVGRDGVPFDILKLRTMVTDAEDLKVALLHRNEAAHPLFKMRDDPRVTRVGRWLRKLSIDELPQLWNVIRGEMSLVGPRPALPAEAVHWDDTFREQRVRVRPGLTGMWQVQGRGGTELVDPTRFDLYYVDNWSFWTDLAIILKTVPVLVFGRGPS